jgi:DNA-binding transcriptional MocR family regulator
VSFDATRAAWAARRAGGLDGGPRLLVALAMAEMTYKPTGELQAGTRGLAALCGVSHSTVTETLRDLQSAGVIECTERGLGSRPTRWRWRLEPPCTPSAPPGDNGTPRAASVTPASDESNANGDLRTASVTLACGLGNNYQDQAYTRVPSHLREATDPAAIPERVAALREHLGGPRGAGRSSSHFGAAPPRGPVLDDGDAWTTGDC